MKKILAFSIILMFCAGLFAQESSGSKDMKNMRFGVTVLPGLYWYKPDNLLKYSKDGVVAKFGVLLNGEYSFSGNFALGFGIGIGSSGGKIDFTGSSKQDTVHYYYNNDNGILTLSDTSGLKGKYEHSRLISRTYNASYFLIPISLKMRTNEIGYMRYFFEPRLNIGIRKKVRVDDNDINLKTGQSSNPPKGGLDITKDMSFMRLSVTLSAGGEYYLSGSTALVFAIGYDYGLSNVVSGDSKYLLKTPYASSSITPAPIKQKFTQSGVILSVGVLF
jgi:hypothetical protein